MEVFEIRKAQEERKVSTTSNRGHGSKIGYVLTMAGIILFTSVLLIAIHFTKEYSLFDVKQQHLQEINSERLEKRSCEEPFCSTKECVSIAATMLQSMNPQADPCSDFYAYACGGYPRVKAIPYAMDSISPVRDARMELLIDIRKLMDAPPVSTEGLAMEKMRKFYDSCYNTSVRNDLQNSSLSFLLEDLGLVDNGYVLGNPLDFEHPVQWKRLVSKLEEYRIHTLFKPHFVEKQHQSAPERMDIDCQVPQLKPEAYINSPDDELAFQMAIYKETMVQTLKLLHLDWEARNEFVEEVLKIETDIARAMLDTGSSNDTELSEENKQLLKDIWRPVVGDAVQEMEIVSTCDYDLEVILNLLSQTPNKSVVKYVTWRMLMQLLQYLGQSFRDLHIHYVTKLPGTDYALQSKSQECTEVLRSEFGLLTTKKLFENGYLKTETLETVHDIFVELKRDIVLLLGEVEELDEIYRAVFKNKLKHMKLTFGYSDLSIQEEILDRIYSELDIDDNYFLNVINLKRFKTRKHLTRLWYGKDGDPISGISLDDTPLGSSSSYDYYNNIVRIDLGLLRPPLSVYSGNVPGFLKYGYSSLIAREMSRAFDSTGVFYHNDDASNQSPRLGIATVKRILDFQDCLENQTMQLKSDSYVKPCNASLNNMFSDLSSFLIPHEGLKSHLRSHLSEKPLPGVPLNKKQTFYVQAAQMMCELRGKSSEDPGSKLRLSPKNRVNLAVMNMEDFGDVFNCPPNSTMAPMNQCSLLH